MSFRYNNDPGSIYIRCRCPRPANLRWDPHPQCMHCIHGAHYMEVRCGLDYDGEPPCPYCRRIRRSERARWADEYRARVLTPPANHLGRANASDVAFANANVEVAAPPVPSDHRVAANEGEDLQPSGVVSEHQGDWAANPVGDYDDPVDMATGNEPESAMDLGDNDVIEVQDAMTESQDANATPANTDSAAPPHGGPDSLPTVFKQVFARASKVVITSTPASAKATEPVFDDFPRMAARDRDQLLPAYPAAERFYRKAEADSSLKAREAVKKDNVVLLTAEVAGLCFKERNCPMPEKEMLANSQVTRGLCRDPKPKHPTSLGAAIDKDATNAWYASTRAANLLSCAGMLTSYLRKLSDSKGQASHFTAMEAANIDTQVFAEVTMNEAGMAFVSEVEQIADALAGLILSAIVDVGTTSAAATLVRRRVWLESCGLKDAYLDQWMKHPTPSGGGLFGATTERVAAFKAEQASKEVLQKEMQYMVKKTFTPTPGYAGRGGSTPAAASNTMRGAYQARAGRGKSRGKHRPYTYNNPQQGGSKTTGSDSGPKDKSAKPDTSKKD